MFLEGGYRSNLFRPINVRRIRINFIGSWPVSSPSLFLKTTSGYTTVSAYTAKQDKQSARHRICEDYPTRQNSVYFSTYGCIGADSELDHVVSVVENCVKVPKESVPQDVNILAVTDI